MQDQRPAKSYYGRLCEPEFIDQLVELPLDVVITVETLVCAALMAVRGLNGLNKPMIPVYEPGFDMRVIIRNMKASLGLQEITLADLLRILRTRLSPKLFISQLKTLQSRSTDSVIGLQQ